jgi:hypothetical protein
MMPSLSASLIRQAPHFPGLSHAAALASEQTCQRAGVHIISTRTAEARTGRRFIGAMAGELGVNPDRQAQIDPG